MQLRNFLIIASAGAGALVQAVCTAPGGSGVAPALVTGVALTTSATLLSSLGANLWSSAIEKRQEAWRATRELLVNEDLAKATATALEQRLLQVAAAMADEVDRDRILLLASNAPAWWLTTVSDNASLEFDALREENLVDGLASLLSPSISSNACYISPPVVEVEAWIELLRDLDEASPGRQRLRPNAIDRAAKLLYEHALHDVYLALKSDFAQDGKAYAAISLRFFAEILMSVRGISATQAQIKPALDQIPKILLQLQEATNALRRAGLPANLDAALATTQDRLFLEIANILAGIDLLLENAVEQRDELRKLRKLLQQSLDCPVNLVPGFQADISRITEYAPADLIGREIETQLLNEAWAKASGHEPKRPHVLTFVALGGEGKTSLVAKWAAELAANDWPQCDAAFAWSFYSQGTRDQMAASSDIFLREALIFFGDSVMAGSAASAFDKGRRLAQLVGRQRTLLILDGLEPLQYSPTSPTPGELKDQGMVALLKGLATTCRGLCIVTTRYTVTDLRAFIGKTVQEEELARLSNAAGVDLLKKLGVKGTEPEFEQLVEDVQGHALTLNLLGGFLRDAHGGDIRKRDLIKFEEADAMSEHGGHAFRVMDAYVQWMAPGGLIQWIRCLVNEKERLQQEEGERALALLQLIGLFDRPATADCLHVLWTGDSIPGLTHPLVKVSENQRNKSLKRLEDAKLLTVSRDKGTGMVLALDAHPLLREYFAKRLRNHERQAWRIAHYRLYQHLCRTTPDKPQPTLEDLQPLYQAIVHGCNAQLFRETYRDVYIDRILRRTEYYSTKRLGAYGSDLGAVACFFDKPWCHVSSAFTHTEQSWLLNRVAYRLHALGRLAEGIEPMRVALSNYVAYQHWKGAAVAAGNLSELEIALGELSKAVTDAANSVIYADRGQEWGDQMIKRTIHANALHQIGRRADAHVRFQEAEQMQARVQPNHLSLYSLQGFQYCDLLLAEPERAAWQTTQGYVGPFDCLKVIETCQAVSERATRTLNWAISGNFSMLTIALDHLTLGRAALFAAILGSSNSNFRVSSSELEGAVTELRRAGTIHYMPLALLSRAWLRALTSPLTGQDSTQGDLDEAWEIAERGPMRLFMADIHLHRARLFFRSTTYPWDSPEADIIAARNLIEKCGYWRRKEELEDAEAVILGKR